jgi:uncharacterized caspase-like protein
MTLRFLLLLAASLWSQQRDLQVESNQRLALVVGNSQYQQSPLRNPINDARAVNASLIDLGFQTEAALDVNLRGLEAAVNRLVSRVRPGDIVVFYYAGHGIQIEGENYLVPVDFNARDEADAKYASYAASRVQERIEKAGARVVILILDACRNNPFQSTRSMGSGLAAMGSGKGTLIAFATAPGKTADDNPRGDNGLFTTHLIQSIKEPGLSLDQIFTRVRERVYNASGGRQVPWTVSSVIGEIYLSGGGAAKPAPVNPLARRQPAATAPPPPAVVSMDRSAVAGESRAAVERGDFSLAIEKAQAVLREEPANKEALLALATAYYRTQEWTLFASTARQALAAGNEFTFLLGHHHTLTGAHPVTLRLTRERVAFQNVNGPCNQNPFDLPVTNIVSASVVQGPSGEVFLNFKVRDENNKQRNLNFTDPDANVVKDENGLPRVVSPPKAVAQLGAVAAVLSGQR